MFFPRLRLRGYFFFGDIFETITGYIQCVSHNLQKLFKRKKKNHLNHCDKYKRIYTLYALQHYMLNLRTNQKKYSTKR